MLEAEGMCQHNLSVVKDSYPESVTAAMPSEVRCLYHQLPCKMLVGEMVDSLDNFS